MRRRPYVVGTLLLAALAVATYFAFHPALPWAEGYRVSAVFQSSNGLRTGSPVRIAGVDVGKVAEIDRGPGRTTLVTMQMADRGRPVHRDATARIRARVFLEGGFLVELSPGTPSAPELANGGTIPLSQTAVPVQFHQALTMFDSPTRESVRATLGTMSAALEHGGAEGLAALAPELEPLLRDLAWTGRAFRGTRPDDVSRTITAMERVTAALDTGPGRIGSLVENLATTARAVRSRGTELGAALRELESTLRVTPAAARAVDSALPALERAGRQIERALPVAPGALRETASAVEAVGNLVAPERRQLTITALETAFRDLPRLIDQLIVTFPATRPLSDCLRRQVLPVLEAEAPDGKLSTGRPVWQDFAHMVVGLAGASQNFDGNGHNLRYQLGSGDQALSTTNVGGLGPLFTNAPSTLRSRPLPRSDRKPPPLVTSEPCASQPPVDLATPDGPGGLTEVTP